MYSETQHHDINLTTCYKPWLPEIDFVDSYVNLSSYHPNYLIALTIGYRITKYSKYFVNSEWGCIMMFPMDPDLADAFYMQYVAGTNYTMAICTPYIPVRSDMRRRYVQTHSYTYSMLSCYIYQPGFLKRLYE